jgi:hypothetical protein
VLRARCRTHDRLGSPARVFAAGRGGAGGLGDRDAAGALGCRAGL